MPADSAPGSYSMTLVALSPETDGEQMSTLALTLMPLTKENVKSFGITLLSDLKRSERLGLLACMMKEATLLKLVSDNDIL